LKKLTGEVLRFTLKSHAQYKTSREIVDLLKQHFKVSIDHSNICKLVKRKEHQDTIDKYREKFLNQGLDVPIAIEKVRLDRAETLYQLSQTLKSDRDKINDGLRCLKEAREEMKGAAQHINFNQYNQYNQMSDRELQAKLHQIEKDIVDMTKKGDSYAVNGNRSESS